MFVMLIAFIGSVGPLFLLPFVNVLPYLQTQQLPERLLWSFSLWTLAALLWFVASSPKQKRSVMSFVDGGWKGAAGSLLGLMMFIYAAAWFSANTFGSLVKIFPGDPYVSRFEVIAVESSGSKYKSLTLDLKSQQGRKTYSVGRQ